ncbi:PAS domain S-box-containing protein [Klenkia soli]|uniref:PAS domain S-box-containing protein n=1 Tax=Klenkia soli TaxID=1052260 RepID=A0A1H0E355_9ACTN|nr:SpoIIE family protein phosphatase [Klenkia soli]SDN76779.1 PAS domain S-box-containing protein [Klenkia soli]
MHTSAGGSGDTSPSSSTDQLQTSVVGPANDALTGASHAAGPLLLSRVLGDSPVAVLLVDRSSGQVTYANTAALALAGDVRLPVATDRWAAAAGVTDIDGTPLAATSEPLSRIAAGDPLAGEPVRVRGTDEDGEPGPVVWATGFPLDTDGDQLSLLVFLPVEQPRGAADPDQVMQALRERAVLATDICFTISDPRQPGNPLVWVNPAFTRVTGYTVEQSVGRNCKFLQGPATDPAAVAQMVADLDAGRSTAVTLLNHRPDGTAFWNHVAISPVRDGAGELVSFVGVQTDVTARVVADAERDAALAAEQSARRAAERDRAVAEAARARLALMAEATTQLGASLDMAELQQRTARLCVPLLADWVAISEVDDEGVVTSVVAEHRAGEAAREALDTMSAQYLGRRFPDTSPNAVAMATGQPVVLAGLTDEGMRPWSRRLHGTDTLATLGTGSVVAIPLTSRSRTWGVFVLVREDPAGFHQDDVEVARDLGRRAGQALDNARRFSQEASVAETLQHALLPELPAIPGLAAAAHYTAASTAAAVGGDFYDLLPLPGGAVGVVIGDVAGHDITAAAAMGQLRGLIRSEAWATDAPDPAAVLARVDRLLGVLGLPVVATAALMRATPSGDPQGGGSWVVECANAGHPPVLVRTPEGAVEVFCDEHGLLLGTGLSHERPPRACTTRELPAGSQLLLYTDGLIEQPSLAGGRVRDIDEGIARLHERWAAMPAAATPDDACRGVDDLVVDRSDDVAVLVVRLGVPRPG